MYYKGQGVPQDDAEAVKWYRLAADQGDAKAQYNLGNMYRKGQGVPQDYAEAVKWYRLAAEQGAAYAQYNLGFMYEKGQVVLQDNVIAHMWYNIASANGDGEAGEVRDELAGLMSSAAIEKAQAMAREWVIPPFLMGSSRRIHAAVFSFIAGVMPPMPMLGRSLL